MSSVAITFPKSIRTLPQLRYTSGSRRDVLRDVMNLYLGQ